MSNPWVALAKLLQDKPRWVGKVVSYSAGKAVVTTPAGIGGGGDEIVVSATSEYAVDDYVFIENGIIQSKAPNLRSASSETVY
jgi:hypothetical protein